MPMPWPKPWPLMSTVEGEAAAADGTLTRAAGAAKAEREDERRRAEPSPAAGEDGPRARDTGCEAPTRCNRGYRRYPGERGHGDRGALRRHRYTARPCGSTRSFRRSPAATPSGCSTLNLRDGLRRAGIDSDIFYGSFTPDVEHEGRPVIELGRTGRDRWLLYQASIGSPVYDILAARSEPKLVNYHNITPAALLARLGAQRGLRGVAGPHAARPVGAAERASPWPTRPSTSPSCGRSATKAPPSCRCSSTCTPRATSPTRRWRHSWQPAGSAEGGADLLYVGKISPHKAPHDLVKMLDVLRRTDDPAARLHLVGSPLGETYEPALRAFIAELGLDDAVLLPGLGHGRRARGLLAGGRRLRDGVGPRGVLRASCRGHGPRRARSSPTG